MKKIVLVSILGRQAFSILKNISNYTFFRNLSENKFATVFNRKILHKYAKNRLHSLAVNGVLHLHTLQFQSLLAAAMKNDAINRLFICVRQFLLYTTLPVDWFNRFFSEILDSYVCFDRNWVMGHFLWKIFYGKIRIFACSIF